MNKMNILIIIVCTIFSSQSWAYLYGDTSSIRRSLSISEHTGCMKSAVTDSLTCWGLASKEMFEEFSKVSNEGVTQVSTGMMTACYIRSERLYCWDKEVKSIVDQEHINVKQHKFGKDADYCLIANSDFNCVFGDREFNPKLLNPRYFSLDDTYVCALDDNGAKCWDHELKPFEEIFLKSIKNPKLIKVRHLGYEAEVCVLSSDDILSCSKSLLPNEITTGVSDFDVESSKLCILRDGVDRWELNCTDYSYGISDLSEVQNYYNIHSINFLGEPPKKIYLKNNVLCHEYNSDFKPIRCWHFSNGEIKLIKNNRQDKTGLSRNYMFSNPRINSNDSFIIHKYGDLLKLHYYNRSYDYNGSYDLLNLVKKNEHYSISPTYDDRVYGRQSTRSDSEMTYGFGNCVSSSYNDFYQRGKGEPGQIIGFHPKKAKLKTEAGESYAKLCQSKYVDQIIEQYFGIARGLYVKATFNTVNSTEFRCYKVYAYKTDGIYHMINYDMEQDPDNVILGIDSVCVDESGRTLRKVLGSGKKNLTNKPLVKKYCSLIRKSGIASEYLSFLNCENQFERKEVKSVNLKTEPHYVSFLDKKCSYEIKDYFLYAGGDCHFNPEIHSIDMVSLDKEAEVLEDLNQFLLKFYNASTKIKSLFFNSMMEYSSKEAILNSSQSEKDKKLHAWDRVQIIKIIDLIILRSTSQVYEENLSSEYKSYLKKVKKYYPDHFDKNMSLKLNLYIFRTITNIAIQLEVNAADRLKLQEFLVSTAQSTIERSVSDNLLSKINSLNLVFTNFESSPKTSYLKSIFDYARENINTIKNTDED